jgi:cell division transport system permease protein
VIISLSLVLFMLGALGLLIINANKLSTHFKENVGFQIYLKDTATSAQIDHLVQELNHADFTKSVTLINKEQAAEKLKADLGEDFVSFLGSNPLLNSLDVKLNASYANTDTLQVIEKDLLQRSFIKEVVYQKEMINKLNKNTRAVAFFIIIFSGALLIVAIALINNTIRLSIYSQRFLIRTMYLVGATRSFISKPFVFKGLRQGIIAGIIAGVLLAGFLTLGTRFIPDPVQRDHPGGSDHLGFQRLPGGSEIPAPENQRPLLLRLSGLQGGHSPPSSLEILTFQPLKNAYIYQA